MKYKKITLEDAKEVWQPCWVDVQEKSSFSQRENSQAFFDMNGFHYEDAWNLDREFAYFILLRLVQLRDVGMGMPNSYCAIDEDGWPRIAPTSKRNWDNALNHMIVGFYVYLKTDFWQPNSKEEKLINRAMKLFSENWQALWD